MTRCRVLLLSVLLLVPLIGGQSWNAPLVAQPAPVVAAQAKAVLTGPKSVAAGKPVALQAAGSIGTRFTWRVYPPEQFLLVGDGRQVAVTWTDSPGPFTVALLVQDGDQADVAIATVVVTGEPDSPDEPEKPRPPKPDAELRTLAGRWLASVTDSAKSDHAKALAANFRATATSLRSGTTIDAAKQALASANGATLIDSAQAWLPFFEALDAEITRRAPATSAALADVLDAIAGGMEAGQ